MANRKQVQAAAASCSSSGHWQPQHNGLPGRRTRPKHDMNLRRVHLALHYHLPFTDLVAHSLLTRSNIRLAQTFAYTMAKVASLAAAKAKAKVKANTANAKEKPEAKTKATATPRPGGRPRKRALPTPPTSPLGPPPVTPPHQLSKTVQPPSPIKFDRWWRSERIRSLLERRTQLTLEADASPLTLLNFPHLLSSIIQFADRSTLLTLRLVCREVKNEVDLLLALHGRVRIAATTACIWGGESTISPMTLRSLGGRSVEVHTPTVVDVDPLVVKMYYLHFSPAWSDEQHERNLWNTPYRPGPWRESWCRISASWTAARPRLVSYTGGVMADDFFQSYQTQKAGECVVHCLLGRVRTRPEAAGHLLCPGRGGVRCLLCRAPHWAQLAPKREGSQPQVRPLRDCALQQ